MDLTNAISYVFVVLAVAKVSQLILTFWVNRKYGPSKGIDYTPSMQALMKIVDDLFLIDRKDFNKIPRKEFRDITDPWVDQYNKRHAKRSTERKVFKSLKEATSSFFKEFCQEDSTINIQFSMHSFGAFLRQPLGLNSFIALCCVIVGFPFLLIRETNKGGNVLSLLCKNTASVTAPEVYVVACKEQLSFEEALVRYPWVSGIFTRKQVHAMLGKTACPLYKREIMFPTKNHVMDFEYEVIASSMVLLRQCHGSMWGDLMEDLYLSQVVVAGLILYLCCLDYLNGQLISFTWFWSIFPYASVFYITREVVDWSLGIKWHPKYRFML